MIKSINFQGNRNTTSKHTTIIRKHVVDGLGGKKQPPLVEARGCKQNRIES
jgi:hypothetical protein